MAGTRKFCNMKLETTALLFGYMDIILYVVKVITISGKFITTLEDKKAEILDVCNVTAKSDELYIPLLCGGPIWKLADEYFVNKTILITLSALPSILLIIGTKKQNHFYLLPWLIRTAIEGLYFIIKNVSFLFYFVVFPFSFSVFAVSCFIFIIQIVFILYALRAIVYLYCQFKNEKYSEKPKIESV